MVYKYICEIYVSFVKVVGAIGPGVIHDSPLPLLPAFLFILIAKFLVLNLLGSIMSVAVTNT